MIYQDKDRPQKNLIRSVWFEAAAGKMRSKNFLTLPSKKALCVREAIRTKVVNKSTRITLVESLNIPIELPTGFKASIIRNKLERTNFKQTFDLVYADLCSQINAEFLIWLKRLKLSDNSMIGFTFHAVPRSHGTFFQSILDGYNKKPNYYAGIHHDDRNIDAVCSLINDLRPDIKINFTQRYKESGHCATMMFIGGYKGDAPSYVNINKIEQRLLEFQKNKPVGQSIGGFKIMWNLLSEEVKNSYYKKYHHILKEINL